MIHDPDRLVGTLMFAGSLAWVAIAATRYGLRCLRERRDAPSAADFPAIADYEQHVADALRMVEDAIFGVPQPREETDAEVAQLRAELDDPTLVRVWLS